MNAIIPDIDTLKKVVKINATLPDEMCIRDSDTRINDWHEKVFRCNEQKNESLDLAGDYCKTGGVQVAITGTDKGQWSIQGKVAKRGNGQCIIGLPPGKYTIEFTDADGKTKADVYKRQEYRFRRLEK